MVAPESKTTDNESMTTDEKLVRAKLLLKKSIIGDGLFSFQSGRISTAVDLIVDVAVERALAKVEAEAEKFFTELNQGFDKARTEVAAKYGPMTKTGDANEKTSLD